jgi:hypothetical protein
MRCVKRRKRECLGVSADCQSREIEAVNCCVNNVILMVEIVLVGNNIEGKRGDGSCNCLFAVIISIINNIT